MSTFLVGHYCILHRRSDTRLFLRFPSAAHYYEDIVYNNGSPQRTPAAAAQASYSEARTLKEAQARYVLVPRRVELSTTSATQDYLDKTRGKTICLESILVTDDHENLQDRKTREDSEIGRVGGGKAKQSCYGPSGVCSPRKTASKDTTIPR